MEQLTSKKSSNDIAKIYIELRKIDKQREQTLKMSIHPFPKFVAIITILISSIITELIATMVITELITIP